MLWGARDEGRRSGCEKGAWMAFLEHRSFQWILVGTVVRGMDGIPYIRERAEWQKSVENVVEKAKKNLKTIKQELLHREVTLS